MGSNFVRRINPGIMDHGFSRFALILLIFVCVVEPLWAQVGIPEIERMIEKGQYDLAEVALKELIEAEPENVEAYYGLMRLALKRDQDSENTQWLSVPPAHKITELIGDIPISALKPNEHKWLRDAYFVLTFYYFDNKEDGTSNCEAARPWLEKAILYDKGETEWLYDVNIFCEP